MFDDPIVTEIRTIKEEIAKENDYDIHKYFSYLKEMEKQHKQRLVNVEQTNNMNPALNKEPS